MDVTIESYISSNTIAVNSWLLNLFSKYAEKLLSKEEDTTVYLDCVCNDERRVHKCKEVLYHYDIIEDCEVNKSRYTITINHKAFLKHAPKLAKAFKFETKPPEKSTDRIKGYPAIKGISKEGLLHIFFNPEKYEGYDQIEKFTSGWDLYKNTEERRVIRFYPKNLESEAEKAVFRKQLYSYFENNIDELVSVMFGFEPETLIAKRDWQQKGIKHYDPERTNEIDKVEKFTKAYVQEKITITKKLLKYGEATLRDLEKVQAGIKEYGKHGNFIKEFVKKTEEHIMNRAPLMMMSEDKQTKNLATMILRGSNKGLI